MNVKANNSNGDSTTDGNTTELSNNSTSSSIALTPTIAPIPPPPAPSSSDSNTSHNTNTTTKKDPNLLTLRIKSNEPSNHNKTITITTQINATISQLKSNIRKNALSTENNDGTTNENSNHGDDNHAKDSSSSMTQQPRYLRLISSGRLLAPDTAFVKSFPSLVDGSVVHAVLAKAGVRGGQQASLARGGANTNSTTITNNSSGGGNNRRFRGSGIGANGLIISRRNQNGDDTMDSDGDSDDDSDDLELGSERIGFDRLRAEGLSRSEVGALRIYFARQIDRFIQQQSELNNINNANSSTTDTATNTNTNTNATNDNNNTNNANTTNTTTSSSTTTTTTTDPRIERLRNEDLWMETQGPHSEFRLNLNANNPLLSSRMYNASIISGLSSRNGGTTAGRFGGGADENGESFFLRDSNTNTTAALNNRGGSGSLLLGTDRDFFWGFVLGYFLGFMMMFWVWMPTVPHKQKLGILAGLCFQITLKMLIEGDHFSSSD